MAQKKPAELSLAPAVEDFAVASYLPRLARRSVS